MDTEAEAIPSNGAFKVAIICALPLEAEAVEKLFDRTWKTGSEVGRHPRDQNTYTVGRIGHTLAVLVWMDDYGKTKAASAATQLRFSFEQIEHALVVGICGGVPTTPDGEELVLGDVAISTQLQKYDEGKQYPDGFRASGTARPHKEMGAFLKKMRVSGASRKELQSHCVAYLQDILSTDEQYVIKAQYPGAHEDTLYSPTHIHKHHTSVLCLTCTITNDPCEQTRAKDCTELKCGYEPCHLVPRARLQNLNEPTYPMIHFGTVGSGDTVMKSGEHRDKIAAKDKVIAFEMEGAGVCEEISSVVIIKGVCDYADSHKNKKWQTHAAAVAAACTRAVLVMREQEHGHPPTSRQSSQSSVSTVSSVATLVETPTQSPHTARRPYSADSAVSLSPPLRAQVSRSPTSSSQSSLVQPMQTSTPEPSPKSATCIETESFIDVSELQKSLNAATVTVNEVSPSGPSTPEMMGPDFTTCAPNVTPVGVPIGKKSAEEAKSLLLEACAHPDPLTASNRLLLDPRFDINARNEKGKSLLHLILGTAKVITSESKTKIATAVQLLCQHKVDVNAVDDSTLTPLHWCVKTSNISAAKVLLEYGAQINKLDKDGRTPFYLLGLERKPSMDMVKMFADAGGHLNRLKLPNLPGGANSMQRKVRLKLIERF